MNKKEMIKMYAWCAMQIVLTLAAVALIALLAEHLTR